VGRRAEARRADVAAQLQQRQDADEARARGIYAAFRQTLGDSIAELRRREDELATMLPLPDDQRRQRDKDLRAMEGRLMVLHEEEDREVAAIRNRYAEVEPFPASVALVFALTSADAASWGSAS
ncbi:MAG TPA: helicase, partial [Arachnia sp.]|nr:helicase [Arachnia sp.]